MPRYAGKTSFPLGAILQLSLPFGTNFFTIRYPRVLRKASHTYALEGFNVAALEIDPRLAACSMFFSLPLLFTCGFCWADLGFVSFLNNHSAKYLRLTFLGRLNTVVMLRQP